ncbi:hypothetical protein KI387_013276, partial [Taxus chinensis]
RVKVRPKCSFWEGYVCICASHSESEQAWVGGGEMVDPVGVGTRGTIGSLMYRELESMRRTDEINKGGRTRNDAVSISCGRPLTSLTGYRLSARKQQDSNARPSFCEGPPTPRCSNVDAGRRSSSGGRGLEAQQPTCRGKLGFGRQEHKKSEEEEIIEKWRNEFRTPMLPKDAGVCRKTRGCTAAATSTSTSTCLVHVVDLTCNNTTDKMWGTPIASRLRRFSFSRLSESFN